MSSSLLTDYLRIPLVDPTLDVATFTFSAAATVFQRTNTLFNPTGSSVVTYTPLIPNAENLLSNLDTACLVHEGNGVAFNENYLLKPPKSCVIDQVIISAAFALNVSAWVDGAALLTYVKFTLQPYHGTAGGRIGGPIELTLRPGTSFTGLSAAGTHVFLVRHVYNVPFEVQSDGPLTLQIQIGKSGESSNDTYQVGIVDVYPINKSSASKRLFPSELLLHLSPLGENRLG